MPEPTQGEPLTPEDLFAEEIEDLERPMLHSWLPWVVAFSTLVVFAGIMAVLLFISPGEYRGPTTAAGIPLITLAEPQGRIEQVPGTFRWQPVRDAATYVVTVTQIVTTAQEETSRAVILRPVDGFLLQPTDAEMSHFEPGLYTWMVEAKDAAGKIIGQGEGAFVLLDHAVPAAAPPT